jgi:ribosomal protein S18 acetylase RimI-like enzyme
VIYESRQLTEDDLRAIAALEQRVVAADGGRLKLEWSALRRRSGQRVEDLLWWDSGELLGFIGLYSFQPPLELAGMVDPRARRRGIGSALLVRALDVATERGVPEALLVVPRARATGRLFAEKHGGVLEHSEHHMELQGTPQAGAGREGVLVRPVNANDVPVLRRILRGAFGFDDADHVAGSDDSQLVIEHEDSVVGAIRLSPGTDGTGIYGFAVDRPVRGRGIGREVLRQVCARELAEGAKRITLEVATDNDRALALYTAVGFVRLATEDYFRFATKAI